MAKKQPNGAGNIYRRSDGRWEGRLVIDGRRRSFFGRSWEEVHDKITNAKTLRKAGAPIPSERESVGQFLQEWLKGIKPQVRDTTWTRYESLLRLHALPTIGRLPLARLSPQRLQTLYSERLTAGLHATTVGHLHRVLHRALGQAVRWDLVIRNPADLARPPKAERAEMKVFSPTEAQRFLQAASEDRLAALYLVALSTGMRQGELLAIKWDALDLDRGALEVRATVHRTRQGFVFSPPKTGKSRRAVLLTPLAVSALRRHRAMQAEQRLSAGGGWADMNLVFCNEVGRPIEPQNLARRSYRRVLERAGLSYRPFHSLRHSAATLLLGRNVHPAIVSSLLGHARVSTTMDVYTHALPSMQQAAVEAMEAVLTG